jgi:hypothetical protein
VGLAVRDALDIDAGDSEQTAHGCFSEDALTKEESMGLFRGTLQDSEAVRGK